MTLGFTLQLAKLWSTWWVTILWWAQTTVGGGGSLLPYLSIYLTRPQVPQQAQHHELPHVIRPTHASLCDELLRWMCLNEVNIKDPVPKPLIRIRKPAQEGGYILATPASGDLAAVFHQRTAELMSPFPSPLVAPRCEGVERISPRSRADGCAVSKQQADYFELGRGALSVLVPIVGARYAKGIFSS